MVVVESISSDGDQVVGFPVILSGHNDVIEDGWDGFYDRIASGVSTTPVVWFI